MLFFINKRNLVLRAVGIFHRVAVFLYKFTFRVLGVTFHAFFVPVYFTARVFRLTFC